MPVIRINHILLFLLLLCSAAVGRAEGEKEVLVGTRAAFPESVLAEFHGDSVATLRVIRPLPVSGHYRTDVVRKVECLYNLLGFRWWGPSGCGLALALLFFVRRRRSVRVLTFVPIFCLSVNFISEWILDEGIPLSTQGGMMNGVCLVCSILSTVVRRRRVLLPVLIIETGLSLWASVLWHHPAVRPVNPSLVSMWLPVHVLFMVVAYGSFLLATVTGLISGSSARVRVLLITGLVSLGAGIVTGSLWASTAWGRWWSWDPKEDFALVTFLSYLTTVVFYRQISASRCYRLILACVFITVLLTWFLAGIFGGNHSYGSF